MKYELMSLPELLNAFLSDPTPDCADEIANRTLSIYSALPSDGKKEITRLDYQVMVSEHPQRIRGDLESYVQ